MRSNQVASHPAELKLGPQTSDAPSFNTDSIPLLHQGSTQPVEKQKSLPKPKTLAAKKHGAKQDSDNQDTSKASLQLVLGKWEPPNDKAAKLAHVKTHYHHELFSLSDTKTEDLAEFGQGLALYFYFLKWIAMLLAAMSLVVLPNMVWSGIARKDGTSTTGESACRKLSYTHPTPYGLAVSEAVTIAVAADAQACCVAGVLVSTSLGAFGPLFGSEYVYNATALNATLTSLGVAFANDQLARGQAQVMQKVTCMTCCLTCADNLLQQHATNHCHCIHTLSLHTCM